ncbi:glutathione S-transferase family protein [Phenylobacterium sp.]|jgi:glutathione S-transferase|uniref:glutathione S-transferase family protein n=1 Tax=Phenylobacterium sp. TaxID=1871053 RepID=UPI002E34DB80|nr:glutathione S-transferase family protein [Phenylobacterium sp.]HEX4709109.1 glutathione S-transferase family protein [Phenylobacterium sp.]
MTDRIALSGAPGSPYTRKMLGVLRYRRIAYRLLPPSGPALAGLPQPKVPLLPTFYLPDEAGELRAVTDSTPIIRRLEREHAGRSLIPTDPALAFLDELIEDYADEWLTKAMFHYRWSYAPDIAKGAALLPCWRGFTVPDAELRTRGAFVAERQIGRLRYVGSNAVTGPVIEASYRRFLAAFEAHLTHLPYLLGHRPAASDFAVFGQLTQLAEFDPTPMALTLELAPRVTAWVGLMEDQSGVEPSDDGWVSMAALPDTLGAILAEIGRVYPPVMLANAEAVMSKAPEVTAQVDGEVWTQQPFPYQAKCLGWLRQSRDNLPARARAQVDAVLAPAGLNGLFA